MSGKVEEYLSKRKSSASGRNAEYWREFEDLYQRKLWHRLTVHIKKAVQDPDFAAKENLPSLYEQFIRDFEHRINQLALVQIGLFIARSYKDKTEGAKFLEKLSGSISTAKSSATATPSNAEAFVLCQASIADMKLEVRDARTGRCVAINDVKSILEEASKKLETVEHVLPEVHGEYYRVSSKYLREVGDYNAYYREALRYLGCIDVENEMPATERVFQAKCLGLAALLGDDIYNIGELLAHPVLKSLQSGDKWLYDLLYAFNSGNIKKFEELRPTWSKQDDLRNQSALLEQKIRLLSLMELAFARPSKDRQISFAEIGKTAQVDLGEVELLVMKAFAIGLVKGYIDEVDKKVLINWVQPRVLDRTQIGNMSDRFAQWSSSVKNIEMLVEAHAEEILTH